MAAAGITKRWVRGSLLITVLVILAAEVMFLYTDYRELYGSVQRAAESRFSTIAGRLQATGTAGDANETSESRGQALRRTVEQFDEKDKFEFMLLDAQGVILATSSGTMTRDLTDGTDFLSAQTSATGVGVLVLVFTIWSGLFFVRSIVRPLGEIEATATKIAKGDLQVRLPDNRYNDEVGRLCKTINQMAEDLAETDRLKNEFISSVSHELRTPLTSIKGWVETIGNIDDPTDKNYQRGLSVIGTETDRLYTMVEELLDFSRLQNGIKLNCQVLDLVAEATDAALFVEARIRQEGLHFVYEEPPDPYPVWADPARLHQVFINILDNAIKYSEPDGTIFLTLTRRGDLVTAAVRDQGRGIAPDDLEKVKQKFFKAKNSVRGSGIGLAVVDEIITALGGRVDIASTLGQGTTVSITLPVYHPGQEHLHEKI